MPVRESLQQKETELKEKLVGYITAGLGLVASLAWNEAIKGLIEAIFPFGQNSLLAKFLYAIIMTAVVVIIGGYLVKLSVKKD